MLGLTFLPFPVTPGQNGVRRRLPKNHYVIDLAWLRQLPPAPREMRLAPLFFAAILCAAGCDCVAAAESLSNARYRLAVASDGAVTLHAACMSPQLITPEFVVMHCQRDPRIFRNFNHPNYLLARAPPYAGWLSMNPRIRSPPGSHRQR